MTAERCAPGLIPAPGVARVVTHPLAFVLRVLRAFQANQGLLLAGAVAYYALLSILPLLILMVIALSHVLERDVLLATLRRALEYVVPGEGTALVVELRAFLDHREAIGWVLLVTMLISSSLGFRVLENALSVIFLRRLAQRRRHLVVSLLLPFAYIAFLAVALFATTLALADLTALGGRTLLLLGHSLSLTGPSRLLMYAAGVLGVILLISAIYYFMPVGRLSARHALIGGTAAGLLWEVLRHALGWYFGTLSHVSVVYGSLTTAIVVLLTLEMAATVLLLGAQVIAEYESLETGEAIRPAVPLSAALATSPLER